MNTTHRLDRWTPEEKLLGLVRVAQLDEDVIGAFLRSVELHEATLRQLRGAAVPGLAAPNKACNGRRSPEAKRVVELERDSDRTKDALAEMAALVMLQEESRRSGRTRPMV